MNHMYIHVHSTLALRKQKEMKGKVNPPNHSPDKQTYIARDTWMPSLENWGGGLKIFCGYQINVQYKLMRDEKEEKSKHANTKNKEKQHNTPKAVTIPPTILNTAYHIHVFK